MPSNTESALSTTIGFIGTGAIAHSVIIGLLEHGNFGGSVLISERSKSRSSDLAKRYSSVSVESDNQTIADQCDLIFLSVLPKQAREVLMRLNLRKQQTLVSLVAGITLDDLRQIGSPVRNVFRMIPLPPIEHGLGPLPICPPSPELSRMFSGCARVIETDDERQFTTFSAVSGLMSTHHAMVATTAKWMRDQGIESKVAAEYSCNMFQALTTIEANCTSSELTALPDDSTTAGGLNEHVLNQLREQGWFGSLRQQLDGLADRLST